MNTPGNSHSNHSDEETGSELPLDVQQAIATLEQIAGDGTVVPQSDSGHTSSGQNADDRSAASKGQNQFNDAEARYQALVEQIPAITFMASLTEGDNELYVSPHVETMLGFTQEEWLGDPFLWHRQLHPDDRVRWAEEFARTCATGVEFKSEYRFLSRDNREVWVHGEARVVRDDNGRPLFLHGIAFDITETKRAEQVLLNAREQLEEQVRERTAELRASQQRISGILESAVDPIITIDDHGLIQSANPATERLFGYSVKDILGQNVRMLMPEPYHSEHDGYLQRYLDTGVAKIIGVGREVIGLRKDGTTFPMELAVSEVVTGDQSLFTGIIRDISERIEFVRALNEAKDASEEANRAKSQFLANMSHELRTPMNAIIGYSEMLEEEAQDLGQEDFIPDLQKIHTAGRHLLELINSILDLSKIEAGKMDVFVEAFDLETLLQEVVTTVQPLVEQKSNSLESPPDGDLGIMHSDQTKLRQCLFNLLSNASKFTENGMIRLQATRTTEDGSDWIKLSVRDSGIGMSSEQLEKVFEAFTQAEGATTRKYGGTGLGLTITKKFCQMLGGDLTAESELGKGTTFTIRVPADIEEDVTDSTVSASTATTGPPEVDAFLQHTVLVVDDDPTVHDLLGRFLSKEGFQVASAFNGEDAVRIAKDIHPMAITLDIMMPGMDGMAVLKRLKEDPDTANIPVVMASMLDNQDQGYALGASAYLTKPVDRQQLTTILEKHRFDNPSCTILIVEDDPTIRQMVVRSLKKTGCRLIEAENGRIGLKRVSEYRPDLILLDLMMPEMNGFEFVRVLRSDESQRSIPIVVLTAKDLTAEDQDRLRGSVESIRQKGAGSREELLNEVLFFLRCSSEDSTGKTK